MEQSASVGKLTEALCKVQGKLKGVKPTKENPFFHSVYAPLCDVIEASRDLLAANGLAIIQANGGDDKQIITFTQLSHVSGEWVRGNLVFPIGKGTPQDITSAITYARRTGWAEMLGLAPDEDLDGKESAQPQPTTAATKAGKGQPSSRQADTTRPPSPPPSTDTGFKQLAGCISEKQAKRMFAIANRATVEQQALHDYLIDLGIEHTNQIKKSEYDMICKWCENGGQEEPRGDANEDNCRYRGVL